MTTESGGVSTEITKRFILVNKELYANFEENDEEAAGLESQKQLEAYKKSRKLPPETIIYKVLGSYDTLREELNRRGWVEHDWEEQGPQDHFKSQAFDFLYARSAKDVFRIPLGKN